MGYGWVKLYRKVLENPFCKGNAEKTGFWIYLLLRANHSPAIILLGNQKISVSAGQFLTGRKKIAKENRISEMKCERLLTCLEIEQQIEQQKFNKFRLISITNWSSYQSTEQQNEQQMNNKRTTDEQQSYENMNKNNNFNSPKNDKEVKNDKEDKKIYVDPPKRDRRGEDVRELFEYWKKVMEKTGTTKFTADRKAKINARLREGHSVGDCKRAILNCSKSPHNMGDNNRGLKYNDIGLIFRNSEKLEYFRDMEPKKSQKDTSDKEAQAKIDEINRLTEESNNAAKV